MQPAIQEGPAGFDKHIWGSAGPSYARGAASTRREREGPRAAHGDGEKQDQEGAPARDGAWWSWQF